MEHENLVKSHGILPILSPHFTKFVRFLLQFTKSKVSKLFRKILNVPNAKFEQRDGHGKSRKSHGKIIGFIFLAKSVGTL